MHHVELFHCQTDIKRALGFVSNMGKHTSTVLYVGTAPLCPWPDSLPLPSHAERTSTSARTSLWTDLDRQAGKCVLCLGAFCLFLFLAQKLPTSASICLFTPSPPQDFFYTNCRGCHLLKGPELYTVLQSPPSLLSNWTMAIASLPECL